MHSTEHSESPQYPEIKSPEDMLPLTGTTESASLQKLIIQGRISFLIKAIFVNWRYLSANPMHWCEHTSSWPAFYSHCFCCHFAIDDAVWDQRGDRRSLPWMYGCPVSQFASIDSTLFLICVFHLWRQHCPDRRCFKWDAYAYDYDYFGRCPLFCRCCCYYSTGFHHLLDKLHCGEGDLCIQ